jgi:alkylation response protein AidB-like acyl-CoA dehydrogenase
LCTVGIVNSLSSDSNYRERGEKVDLALSEEQVALQDSTRTLLAKAFPTAQVRACEIAPRTAMAAYNKLDAHGLGGLLVPEVHGGVGLGAVEMVVVQIELGRALVPALYTDSTVVAATALLTAANPEFAAVIEGIASGQIKLACALGCSEDTLPVFVERGGRRVLEGRVGFVTEAELADWLLVAARDETGGAMLCLIKSDAVGLHWSASPTLPIRTWQISFSMACSMFASSLRAMQRCAPSLPATAPSSSLWLRKPLAAQNRFFP